jgi:hypothetical protein
MKRAFSRGVERREVIPKGFTWKVEIKDKQPLFFIFIFYFSLPVFSMLL